jgi:hypothetical protein
VSDVPFIRQFQADCDDLIGARWWNEAMRNDASLAGLLAGEATRRSVLKGLGIGAIGVAIIVGSRSGCQSDTHDIAELDSLEAQRRSGWNVGASGNRLYFYGLSDVDAAGQSSWAADLDALPRVMAPSSPDLLPFNVPTLFQVLSAPDFHAAVGPIHTSTMDVAAAEARGLGDLFRDPDHPADTALLIDATGPEAISTAAALADQFDPVFLFDNWPHPKGVVASHEVIAAAIYERPRFESASQRRRSGAPPMFVIDSRRLSRYTDDKDSFDNRYLARLPSAAAFQRLGVRHLLYVSDVPIDHEPDDLNDDFVALAAAGIDVKMVALSDFRPASGAPGGVTYSYGGSPAPHFWFWRSYGWHTPVHVRAPAAGPPPLGLSPGASYRPVSRPTIFSSHLVGGLGGVGKQKPSGFGRVSMRTSRATGAIELGRSGSFGRSRSFWSGG